MDLASKRTAVLKMLNSGKSQRTSRKCWVWARTFIWRAKKVYEETGKTTRRPGQGRKRSVRTPRLAKAIRAKIRRNPSRSMNQMAKEYKVSARTIRRVVKDDLKWDPTSTGKKQLLTKATKAKRKARAKLLLNWYAENPDVVVIFSDEKLFEVSKKFNSQMIEFWPLIPLASLSNIRDVYRMQKPSSVMVWGAVASNGKKSPLFRIPDGVKINRNVYLDFLKTKVLPWVHKEFAGVPVCFQQDGAPAHTAKVVQAFCAANFECFWSKEFWPPSSPDLNPLDFNPLDFAM